MNENLMTKGPQINFLKIWSLGSGDFPEIM